ncbi:hypothetical protein AAG906_034266 [Vitis piasezkii]
MMLMVFQVLSLNFLHQQVEDCLGKAARILHVPLKKGTWIVPLEGAQFASSGSSSPKHNLGKSCRQIRRRETRGSFNGRQVSDSLESQRDATGSNHHLNQNGRDRDMERALEHQAQLIGQYEAEEKAQRDSCEPGNHSDVTEERDEVKPQAPSAAGILTSRDQGTKLDDEDVHFNEESSQTLPTISTTHLHGDMECLQEQNHSSMLAYESLAPDFVFPMAKENLHQEFLENQSYPLSHSSHHYPWDHSEHVRDHSGHSTDHSADATDHSGHITDHSEHVTDHSADVPLPSYVGSKGESSRSQDKHYALVPRETSNELGGVLEALQQARLSLQHKLNRLPLIEGGSIGRAIEPSFPSTRAWERVEIPVGCTGLFRQILVIDFSPVLTLRLDQVFPPMIAFSPARTGRLDQEFLL